MVKIRKKTSNRQTTRQREMVKKRISASHKKAKKEAKNEVTWKSRVKKDPGIPAAFPYKERLLKEMKEAKEKKAADRQARALAPSSLATDASALAALSGATSENMSLDIEEDETQDVVPESANLRTHAKSLKKVIELSDVIVEVLDARDPIGTRSMLVEKEVLRSGGVQRKKLVLVLNKIDLVPRENVLAWLVYLRRIHPTLPFKSSTQSQRSNLSSRANFTADTTVATSTSTQPLISLLKNFSRSDLSAPSTSTSNAKPKSLTVGIIGYPNVGKSSLINTLKRSKACGVAPVPGYTKQVQEIVIDKGLKVLDCPGVVLESGEGVGKEDPRIVLRNAVKVEDVQDPIGPVEFILNICKSEHLMMLYNIPVFQTVQDFLVQVARSRGRIRKGGLPDLTGAARMVLRDWQSGRIPYYTNPPTVPEAKQPDAPLATMDSSDVGSATIVTELAPEFDLGGLYGEADKDALRDLKGSKEMGKSLVKIVSEDAMAEPSDARVSWVGGEQEDAEMEVEDEPAISHKRKAEGEDDEVEGGAFVSVQPPKKRVSFAGDVKKGTTQKDRMFEGEEAPVQANKAIKKAAKKDKKKKEKEKRRVAGGNISNAAGDGDAEMAGEQSNQPYNFSEFFGAGGEPGDMDEEM
ncbi:P-loop containing nucleoside triphosphate hydrolase protein [Atractiella rhizophila]|nr:P-loop containing nucleoside triphosphate hydrolase protein [Atractiella rhizophila]